MISSPQTQIDMETFHRYAGLSLPRHVSYPMPTWWCDGGANDATEMQRLIMQRREPLDLSLYVHIPFCEALCKFCACCRIILRKTAPGAEERTEAYVAALEKEIGLLAEQYGPDRRLRQIHWGGGTPTYLSPRDLDRIAGAIARGFNVADDAEVSIEIDPRVVTTETLSHLRSLGFNRVSLGVQDFQAEVQKHVKRVQPYEMVKETIDACREHGFESINFDLIYGLPYQTIDSMRDTLEKCIELSPDRVAYYHYAQVPEKIATQRAIHHEKMPDSNTKLAMFLLGVDVFGGAGYNFVGLDHFAKSEEILVKAARDGTLQRNFQGMTSGGGLDLLGSGASSISHIHQVGFLQNVREPDHYVELMNEQGSAIHRTKPFSDDDCIRQAVISQVYCGARIVPSVIEDRFGIDFASYFQREISVMHELEQDGIVSVDDDGAIDVIFPLGRVLMRNVAAVFDAYLEHDAYRVGDKYCFSANA